MALVGLIFGLLLSFYLLAKICNDFFVPSLDRIAKKRKMSSDMAGATLMAIGSSSPELFVAIFAVLHPGSHAAIGMGNIVGSAIFNILVIIGATAFVKEAFITWQPALRDIIFYTISVIILIVVFWDAELSLLEGIVMISFYVIYVFAVANWKRILPYKEQPIEHGETNEKEHKWDDIVKPIDYVLDKIFPPLKYCYTNFLISIVFISLLSMVLVESAIEISSILHIPEAIIALTVLAIGTSIPDLVSSVIVAKQGRGDMAISNAVGSNIFDILIGLGLPFLIIIIISGGKIHLNLEDLEISVILLLGSVLFLFLIFLLNRWNIGKKTGTSLIILYVVYLVYQIWMIY